jgi:hypothetical protein
MCSGCPGNYEDGYEDSGVSPRQSSQDKVNKTAARWSSNGGMPLGRMPGDVGSSVEQCDIWVSGEYIIERRVIRLKSRDSRDIRAIVQEARTSETRRSGKHSRGESARNYQSYAGTSAPAHGVSQQLSTRLMLWHLGVALVVALWFALG